MAEGPLIVGFGGSTSASSVTTRLLTACLAEVAVLGARTTSFTAPALASLPIFDAGADADFAAAGELVEAIRKADCVVIATPGYHGGMSGLVKNALDHLELLRADKRPYLEGRAVGVIVAASGWQACGTALVSVRSAIHALRGWPTPFGMTVNSAQPLVGPDGEFNAEVSAAMRILANQLADFASWRAAAAAAAARE